MEPSWCYETVSLGLFSDEGSFTSPVPQAFLLWFLVLPRWSLATRFFPFPRLSVPHGSPKVLSRLPRLAQKLPDRDWGAAGIVFSPVHRPPSLTPGNFLTLRV